MLKNVVVPKKNWDSELYEILRHLQLQAQQAAGGLAAVGRGEKPDGSGDPLIDTGIFFLLAGRPGNQLGYGGTASSGTLTFSSTSSSTKGFIYFGSPTKVLTIDETNKLVGINTSTPSATLHIKGASAAGSSMTPNSDISALWAPDPTHYYTGAGTPFSGSHFTALASDDGSTSYTAMGASGANPEHVGLNGTISENKVYTVIVKIFKLGGTFVAGDNFRIGLITSVGNQYDSANYDLNEIGSSATQITLSVSTSGSTVATGVTANSLRMYALPATGYACVTYIAVSEAAGDLIRWDNSSGTQLGRISGDGKLGIGTGSTALTAMEHIQTDAAGTVGLSIKAFASQSARLLQINSSSNVELGGFSSAGAMFFISGAASGKVWTSDSGGVGSWGDIDQARTWATLQTFKDTTFKVVDDADASKTLVFSLGAASANADLTLVWAGTGDRTVTFPDYTGLIPIVGDDPPAVAAGALGKVDLTAQTADIASTNLSNGGKTGLYDLEVILMCTTSDGAAGSVTVTVSWTDLVGATTSPTTRSLSLGTGRSVTKTLLQLNSGEISYAVTHTGTYGTAQYALYIRLVYLG